MICINLIAKWIHLFQNIFLKEFFFAPASEKNHQSVLPLKSIMVYPLQKNFRAILAS